MANSVKLGILTIVAALGLVCVAIIATMLGLHLYGSVAMVIMFMAYTLVLRHAEVRFNKGK